MDSSYIVHIKMPDIIVTMCNLRQKHFIIYLTVGSSTQMYLKGRIKKVCICNFRAIAVTGNLQFFVFVVCINHKHQRQYPGR